MGLTGGGGGQAARRGSLWWEATPDGVVRLRGSATRRAITLSNRFPIQLCWELVDPLASPRLDVVEEDPLDFSYFE